MIRILVADDSATSRALLVGLLSGEPDFQIVGEATNGREAVELTQKLTPDLITMDVQMPVMDGLQAIPRVRAGSPDTAIVVLSGFARGRVDRQARASGAVAYVEKGEAFSVIVSTLLDVTAVAPAV